MKKHYLVILLVAAVAFGPISFGAELQIHHASGETITLAGKTFYLNELVPQQSFATIPVYDPNDPVNISRISSENGAIQEIAFSYKGSNDDLVVDTIELRWVLTREVDGLIEVIYQGYQTTAGELIFNGAGTSIRDVRIPAFDDMIKGFGDGSEPGKYRIYVGVDRVLYKGGTEQKCVGLAQLEHNQFIPTRQQRSGACADSLCDLLIWNGGPEYGIIRWWSCEGYAPGIDCIVTGSNMDRCSMSICSGSPQ
jgi:hypothetical protein